MASFIFLNALKSLYNTYSYFIIDFHILIELFKFYKTQIILIQLF